MMCWKRFRRKLRHCPDSCGRHLHRGFGPGMAARRPRCGRAALVFVAAVVAALTASSWAAPPLPGSEASTTSNVINRRQRAAIKSLIYIRTVINFDIYEKIQEVQSQQAKNGPMTRADWKDTYEQLTGAVMYGLHKSFAPKEKNLFFSFVVWKKFGSSDMEQRCAFLEKKKYIVPLTSFERSGGLCSLEPLAVFGKTTQYALFWSYGEQQTGGPEGFQKLAHDAVKSVIEQIPKQASIKEKSNKIKASLASNPDQYAECLLKLVPSPVAVLALTDEMDFFLRSDGSLWSFSVDVPQITRQVACATKEAPEEACSRGPVYGEGSRNDMFPGIKTPVQEERARNKAFWLQNRTPASQTSQIPPPPKLQMFVMF